MIQAAVSKILQSLAEGEARDGYPGFVFLDTFGEEIASGFAEGKNPNIAFHMGADGSPEPAALPEGVSFLSTPVVVYNNRVGTLVTLYQKTKEAKAKKLSEVGRALAAFAAEKNFELDDLSAALNRLFEERAFLYEITAELGDSSDLPDFCIRLAKRVASILESPQALVLLNSPDRSEYRVAGAFGLEDWLGKAYPSDAGVCGSVIATGKPQWIEETNGFSGGALSDLESEARRCLLAAPIASGTSGGGIGALCVMDGGRSGSFTSEEAKLLSFIGEYVASLVSGLSLVELKKEVQIAQRIIEGLLPDRAPAVAGFELAGKLSPARVVGGDYFDYLPMTAAGGKTGVVIADVSGHTLSATLLMTVARAAFRWAAADSKQASPCEVLATVAKRLHEDLSSAEFFMSMFLIVLDEERKVRFGNAGHPPALLYRAKTGHFEELDSEGTPAGIFRDATYEESATQLEVDDVIVLYTDGITEAAKPESEDMFGIDRLKEAIRRSASLSAEQIVETIFHAAQTHADGAASDDLTVVVVKGKELPAKGKS